MDSLAAFEAHRDRLFGVAYRMTGSVADAHDICQDAWLKWQAVDTETVDNAEAFLVRAVTRLAIDRARSAQVRRETYVGPFLPEPLVNTSATDPQANAELADSLTFAFLVVLDELSPVERAVFLLHDVFAYSFDEISAAVDRSTAACRQIASRTRHRIADHKPDVRRIDNGAERALIEHLIALTIAGDIEGLMAKCAPDVVELADAGSMRRAARYPVVGPARVARLMVNLAKRIMPAMTMEFVRVNEGVGVLFRDQGEPDMVMVFGFTPDGQLRRVFVQRNLEKLRHIARPSSPI